MEISCIMLAGGKSSRLKNKIFLSLKNKPLIVHVFDVVKEIFSDIVIVVKNEKERKKIEKIIKNVKIIKDRKKIYSPIVGIKEGLKHIKNDYVFIIAADMPFISKKTIQSIISKVKDNFSVIPARNSKKYEPLCAVYRKDAFKFVRSNKSLHETIDKIKNKIFIPIKNPFEFFNVNTKEDLKKAEKLISKFR